MIWTLLFLTSLAHAEFTPLPASTPESTNSNFKAIDEEVRRIDSLVTGISSTGYITASSSPTWTGAHTFVGTVAFTLELSSETFITANTTTGGTAQGICSSTVTYSIQGSSVGVYFIGAIENQSANGITGLSILMDGAYTNEYPAGTGISASGNGSGGYPHNASFPPTLINTTPGIHKFCIFGYQTDGTTAYWGYHNSTNYGVKPRFGVREWR